MKVNVVTAAGLSDTDTILVGIYPDVYLPLR